MGTKPISIDRAISRSIQQFNRRSDIIGGELGVLHTFGSDRKFHPHFHVLRTQGGINKSTLKWEDVSYIPEAYLKGAWKSKFLNLLRKAYREGTLWYWGNKQEFYALLNNLYHKDWHVYIRCEPVEDSISISYIGRYVKRAPFSQRLIVGYKKSEYVKLQWKTKATLSSWQAYAVPVFEFMESLIIHIPNRYDHFVYYSGLFAPVQKKRLYQKAMEHFKKEIKDAKVFTWSTLKKLNWNDDPLKCPSCGGKMIFVRAIHFLDPETMLYEVKNYQLVVKGLDSS
ncbi:transposase [Candidatus Saganbacteria bacterium]|nr:transposase [Candidatus Saganbacteria bacterium]